MDRETKLNIIKELRNETGCGLYQITQGLDALIYALKHKPSVKTDVGHRLKIDWEEYNLPKTNRQMYRRKKLKGNYGRIEI